MRRPITLFVLVGCLTLASLLLVACSPKATPTPTAGIRPASTGGTWTSSQASLHIGERGTVCGYVSGTNYATGSKGAPTFINFDKPYPNHTFTVLIWGSDRSKFPSSPETYYRSKMVCATGLIEAYGGKPEIVVTTSSQLAIR